MAEIVCRGLSAPFGTSAVLHLDNLTPERLPVVAVASFTSQDEDRGRKEAEYPAGFGRGDVITHGATGRIVHDEASETIIKTPIMEDDKELISREREIYERLNQKGGHQGILKYYGAVEFGIRLEYAPFGDLGTFQREYGAEISMDLRLQWCIQIAEALAFVHEAGVIHGDLAVCNIFLDDRLNAKLADFAGSSLDGSELMCGVGAAYEHPDGTLSTQGDIFAFGSLVFEIVTQAAPYAGFCELDITDLYKAGQFADTASLGETGNIIRKCWTGQYEGFRALIQDLRDSHASCCTGS